ncbi:ABC transporter permease [Stieleria marina]|uniref:Macrolide export ATP-binding/permease protein MacB n=1 Tax=Stieleria marina TaxID=1930275 RepID=A0A517NUS2_9BACT|nr:Macrolide export ATP-binding/permease protein MacB [Planctomycetes bacterium K23_9]
MWRDTIQVGVKNLLLHKLRSLLTMLGVILGAGSVIAMLAIGEGSKREALEQIRLLGANNIIIRSVKPGQGGGGDESSSASQQATSAILEYGLKYRDFERLKATIPTILNAMPIALVTQPAFHNGRNIPNARILGVTPDYLGIKNAQMRHGRFISSPDGHNRANVAVLGAGAAQRLFQFKDPLGQSILLGEDVYRVIGVLSGQGSGNATPGAVGQQDLNDDIYIPIACARTRFGEVQGISSAGTQSFERTELNEITLQVADPKQVSLTAGMVRVLLEQTHPIKDDFRMVIPLELLKRAEEEKRIWNLVLGSIAGISLLVGGIGIMNIMLASVTERTREIGIRRALGAKRRDITFQFLVETVLLSSTGGVLGVVLGVTIPWVVSNFSDIETIVQWWSVALAFFISVGVGVIFGVYPARRAAMMDPIEALRHE